MKYATIIKRNKWVLFTFLFLFSLFLLFNSYYFNTRESFETIVTDFNSNNTGFYAMFFKILNHYMYCKHNKSNFKIDSSGWLFQVDKGWEDFFEPTELIYHTEGEETINYTSSPSLQEFTIKEYQNAIPSLYKYNQTTKEQIKKKKTQLNLPETYDSIFVRRGDKLANESKFLKSEDYIRLLLKKNPGCSDIFLQTDDYNSYLDLQKYISDNQLKIRLYTLCEENDVGAIVHSYRKEELASALSTNSNNENKEYLSSVIDKMKKTTSVEEMTKGEKYKHVITMISGIDAVVHSNICITDYQSNVARFIKLYHKKPGNVYNIMDPDNDIDYNKKTLLITSF